MILSATNFLENAKYSPWQFQGQKNSNQGKFIKNSLKNNSSSTRNDRGFSKGHTYTKAWVSSNNKGPKDVQFFSVGSNTKQKFHMDAYNAKSHIKSQQKRTAEQDITLLKV